MKPVLSNSLLLSVRAINNLFSLYILPHCPPVCLFSRSLYLIFAAPVHNDNEGYLHVCPLTPLPFLYFTESKLHLRIPHPLLHGLN